MSKPQTPGGFQRFALLVESLLFSPSRKTKLALLENYFQTAPDEDRGYALALLTGELTIETVRPAQLRGLVKTRVEETLFSLSHAYVGDMAETIALIWPVDPESPKTFRKNLADLVVEIQTLTPLERFPFLDRTLDHLGERERWAFVKLCTGSSWRIGVSTRLTRQGLAQAFKVNVTEIEQVWSAFTPPYFPLFEWLDGKSPQPVIPHEVFFHPPMLASNLNENDLRNWDPSAFVAEWKWDGIRVQLAGDGEKRTRLFSRTGEEITTSFPDIVNLFHPRAVVDGELLVRRAQRTQSSPCPDPLFADVAPFNDLQQRLNRKTVSSQSLSKYPAMLCLYDLLFLEGRDLRMLPWKERRALLESWMNSSGLDPIIFRLSPTLDIGSWDSLNTLRQEARTRQAEGLMVKRTQSPYLAGRVKGHWFKWKRDPLNLDTVLLYAQRGHGKRASFYSDYTFGVWTTTPQGERELVPIGKAYSGFTDEELNRLDRWVRTHTRERYGSSVRAVEPELVLEVIFDDVRRSPRHRSGLALRFPRIHRIRWNKPATEADTLQTLEAML